MRATGILCAVFSLIIAVFTTRSAVERITLTNPTHIFVADSFIGGNPTTAYPYPSNITVSGLSGSVSKVTVTLTNLNFGIPTDVDILLVGPGGQSVIPMSDAKGDESAHISNKTLTFDDAALLPLPSDGTLRSGTYKPTNFDSETDFFPAPAPVGPHGTTLSVFNGTNPNGTWSLYMVDDLMNDPFGELPSEITGGWSLAVTTQETPASATPIWSITGDLNVARMYHAATLLPDGRVLTIGGSTSAEIYDPATGRWTNRGNSNIAHYLPTATLLPNGTVLVVSDSTVGSPPAGGAELFDPSTGTWSLTGLPNNTEYRSFHTATLLPNGKVLVAGGANGDFLFITTRSTELYDPVTGTWTSTGNLDTPRALHTATLLPNGRVLVVGGVEVDEGGPIIRSSEIYDPATGIWTTTGSLNTARSGHTATLLPNGKVLVAGGLIQLSVSKYLTTNVAELYEPSTGIWTVTGSLHTARHHQAATLLPDGKVLVAAGSSTNNVSNTPLNTAESYNPSTGTWSITSSLNTPRYRHTATLLSNGKVLVAGGGGRSGNVFTTLKSAELFDLGLPTSGTLTSVSAASYGLTGLASEAIAAGFGVGLATTSIGATTLPLPNDLGGTTVKVKDSAGEERLARLFFVSPTQVNYQIPAGTAAGVSEVTITSADGTISTGVLLIQAVAPSLFAANADGRGMAAGVVLRVRADGSQQYEPIAQFDPAQNKFVSVPLDLGPEGDRVFLIMFGTGLRFRSSLSAVVATIGGAYAQASFAEAHPDFVGVDQVNLLVPHSLAGCGEVDVLLTVDAKLANPLKINIK